MNLKTFCLQKLKENKDNPSSFPNMDAIMYPAFAEYCRQILHSRSYAGYYANRRLELMEAKKKTVTKVNGKAA